MNNNNKSWYYIKNWHHTHGVLLCEKRMFLELQRLLCGKIYLLIIAELNNVSRQLEQLILINWTILIRRNAWSHIIYLDSIH